MSGQQRANPAKNHVFIDGQNLYMSARAAFGLRYPDFDIRRIGEAVSREMDPDNDVEVNFYIGMPVRKFSPRWTEFWTNKVDAARNDGVNVTTRPLRYITETDPQAEGGVKVLSTREKGIDLRIALDAMAASRQSSCGNIMIVSRDQDFSEVIEDIRMMADFTRREIGVWSAYPVSDRMPWHNRGIDGTREVPITREIYDRCRDTAEYRGAHTPRSAAPEAGNG